MNFAERKNPISIMCYLILVIIITMFSTNPIMLGISYMSSILLFLLLTNFRKTLIKIAYSLFFMLFMGVINPIFSQNGSTILFIIGNFVVALESIMYGVSVGCMLSAVMIWFASFNILLNADKMTYIFSKYTPKIGTIITVSLGLIPKYYAQYKKIDGNMKALGVYDNVKYWQKIKLKMHALSTLVTWSIESSLTLSDSMSARGYELKGKRVYGRYVFGISDFIFLLTSLVIGIGLIVFLGIGTLDFEYYPTFTQIVWNECSYLYIVTFAFMNVFTVLSLGERAKWRYLIAKI